ncbi:MAG: DEAD/DEAH box helicase [Prevotella sp.]|nr:DEAD/DEAH box helicase [Prevotella sp.]
MEFEQLYLTDNILDALDDMRFTTCTPIQEKCIPLILDGKDVIGIAQTGTGKTAAYLLPILSLMDEGELPDDKVNCLIMCPTRELAQQIDQAMVGFSYYLDNVNSVAVYGGNDGSRFLTETNALKMGANVVIATPGRLLSHIQMGHVDLSDISFFVLDEADRMLDMGFSDDILKISKLLPKSRQTVMFSATMPEKIEMLAKQLMTEPDVVKIAVSKPAEKIRQTAYLCHENQKIGLLRHLFEEQSLKRVIIFCGSKIKVKEIKRMLSQKKISCAEMHSDLTQQQRDETMYDFKIGKIDILVATDIVARGIDIDDISTVINFDVPHDAEDYVHRIGRTARAERSGLAITLVRGKEVGAFMNIEKFLNRSIEKLELPESLGKGPEYKEQMPKKENRKRRYTNHNKKNNRKQGKRKGERK